jgi:hypothetical protein
MFVIDACRDNPNKSGSNWGETDASEQFIRILGCGPGEVCQVIVQDKTEVSLFTRALAEVVENSAESLSINQLVKETKKRCAELSEENGLNPQEPRHSVELSDAVSAVLEMQIFPTGDGDLPPAERLNQWPYNRDEFDPNRFHYIVVNSEHTRVCEHCSEDSLQSLVQQAIGKAGDSLWPSFRDYWSQRTLLGGKARSVTEKFSFAQRVSCEFNVQDVFGSDSELEAAVRGVIEADLAVFDLTGFEPAVMLLLGIRSAVHRGVTVCTHGAGWQQGTPVSIHDDNNAGSVPFNLQDLSLTSYSYPSQEVEPEQDDPVVQRLAKKIQEGFRQMAEQPSYLDLPAFDSLRRLGPTYEAGREYEVGRQVLLFCPFSDTFTRHNLTEFRGGLALALDEHDLHPKIRRVLDLGSPRLISQSIYEQLRRVSMCVVDWTDFSPSVFLEAGARLAVSELGAVQVIDKTRHPELFDKEESAKLSQYRQLFLRFNPTGYEPKRTKRIPFKTMVRDFLDRKPEQDEGKSYRRIYDIVLDSIDRFQESVVPVHVDLNRDADTLDSPHQKREGGPRILFRQSTAIKRDSEAAALDRRVAAWLYLEHRLRAGELDERDPIHGLYLSLGRTIIKGLNKTRKKADRALAKEIRERLKQSQGGRANEL